MLFCVSVFKRKNHEKRGREKPSSILNAKNVRRWRTQLWTDLQWDATKRVSKNICRRRSRNDVLTSAETTENFHLIKGRQGTFRLRRFCFDKQLTHCVAINWIFFQWIAFHCPSRFSQQNCCNLRPHSHRAYYAL